MDSNTVSKPEKERNKETQELSYTKSFKIFNFNMFLY
jgi:hypothetical protein